MDFTTKDSGRREEYASGMVRDTEEGKARFDLLLPKGVPYSEQMLTRFAELMARGAKKYGDRNWEKADSETELERYRSSALRHLAQWAAGERDEDHAAAVMFNLLAGETVLYKIEDRLIEEDTRRLARESLAPVTHDTSQIEIISEAIGAIPPPSNCGVRGCMICSTYVPPLKAAADTDKDMC